MVHPQPKLCFVISPIGSEGSEERKHADLFFFLIVKNVIADDNAKYRVQRADQMSSPGMINDQVIHAIIESDIAVCDMTNLNPNVFWELGIPHAAEKPVIHFAKTGTKLPFDTAGHRTCFYDLGEYSSILAARAHLANSIEEIESPHFRVSNPITQANAQFRMRNSADTDDNITSLILDRLAGIEELSKSNVQNEIEIGRERMAKREAASNIAYKKRTLEQSLDALQYEYNQSKDFDAKKKLREQINSIERDISVLDYQIISLL